VITPHPSPIFIFTSFGDQNLVKLEFELDSDHLTYLNIDGEEEIPLKGDIIPSGLLQLPGSFKFRRVSNVDKVLIGSGRQK